MKKEDYKITFRNLINTIDVTVLELKKAKKQKQISDDLKSQVLKILNFINNSKTDSYIEVLNDKGIYIEQESLEKFHLTLNKTILPKDDIEKTIKKLDKEKNFDKDEFNFIQSLLIKISIPIWNTTKQLNN